MTHGLRAAVLICVLFAAISFAEPDAKTVPVAKTSSAPSKSKPSTKKQSKAKTPKPVSAEEESKIMGFTKTNIPTMHKRLVDAKDQSEKRYQYLLRIAATHVRSLMSQPPVLRTANIKLAQSKIRLYKLFQAYLKAGNKKDVKAELKPQIQNEIAQQFDAKMAIRTHRLSTLEEQLRQLQDEVNHTKQGREKAIQRDTDKMVQHADKGQMPSSLRPHSPSKKPSKSKATDKSKAADKAKPKSTAKDKPAAKPKTTPKS